MRPYELVFVLKPDLKSGEEKRQQEKIVKLTESLEGKVKKQEVWGERQLAYPIQKFEKGVYVKFELELPEKNIREWDKKMKLEEKIIRYLLIRRATS
ncbi:MAG TPA: 30S ribosomal protein S6 [Candidatus Bathyarchaeia archaeon]|nr:30S ribosomal protein S6 [Candidatus Bathyarchaeia archaeon]